MVQRSTLVLFSPVNPLLPPQALFSILSLPHSLFFRHYPRQVHVHSPILLVFSFFLFFCLGLVCTQKHAFICDVSCVVVVLGSGLIAWSFRGMYTPAGIQNSKQNSAWRCNAYATLDSRALASSADQTYRATSEPARGNELLGGFRHRRGFTIPAQVKRTQLG